MTEQDIKNLLKKYHAGECSLEELAFINSWYNHLEGTLPNPDNAVDFERVEKDIWSRLGERQEAPMLKLKRHYPYRTVAAAAVMFIAVAAFYFLRPAESTEEKLALQPKQQDIPAGTNTATLTLSTGQQILLDSAANGMIASQSGVTITKTANGQIIYKVSPPSPQGDPGLRRDDDRGAAYNTINTPNGGQYQVVLPDGSHVWLNAASSLKYPIKFKANERRVVLIGEGYFEIAKKMNQPFIVSSEGQTVKVLGTHFNVSCYAGEPLKTTLAEGRIALAVASATSLPKGERNLILQPDQQAVLSSFGSESKAGAFAIRKVNAQDIIAWKDGLFVFNDTQLRDVMRQIARWYNVEVDYASIPDVNFDGEISRKTTLLQVLKLIEAGSELQFKLEGRRIVRK